MLGKERRIPNLVNPEKFKRAAVDPDNLVKGLCLCLSVGSLFLGEKLAGSVRTISMAGGIYELGRCAKDFGRNIGKGIDKDIGKK